MIEFRVIENSGKTSIGLNDNSGHVYSLCCEVIESVFANQIMEIERIPTPKAFADIYKTYKLDNGEIKIDLDEAWGIDIFPSEESFVNKLVTGFNSNGKFKKIT